MKRIVIVLCLCMAATLAYGRSAIEIKADIAALKEVIQSARSNGADVTEAKREYVALRKELRVLMPRRAAARIDEGGDVCDDAPWIDFFPYYDSGVIDEFTGDDYDYADECGDEGSEHVYNLEVEEEDYYTISTCGSDFDTVLELWNRCPDDDDADLIECNDDEEDDCDDNDGFSSCIDYVHLEEGTYVIVVFGFDFDEGDYVLSVVQDDDCEEVVVCEESAENAYCSSAAPLVLSNGSATVAGSSIEGSFPQVGFYCETDIEACGLWYRVTGNGSMMSAHTCDSTTDYDTKLHVFEGSCDGLVCIDGNDDWYGENGEYCFANFLASRVEWCAEVGVEYYILVSGYSGDTGDFRLTVEDSEIPCGPCEELDYYFTLDEVPFCQCLSICEGQIQKIFVGPAGPNDRPVATWSEGCQVFREIPPGGCDDECEPANPTLYMEWIYLPDQQLWCMDLESASGGCYCFCIDRILPVELNSFAAIAGDGSVSLTWATGSESNLDRFEIERDGETVAHVAATNSASGFTYAWNDMTVDNGTMYTYALIARNMDGSREELATQSATPSDGAVATEYFLYQNYPNPFNPETAISFNLPTSGEVTLSVFNPLGQKVSVLASGTYAAGLHTVKFNGAGLPSGLYFYVLEAGDFSAQNKMLLLK